MKAVCKLCIDWPKKTFKHLFEMCFFHTLNFWKIHLCRCSTVFNQYLDFLTLQSEITFCIINLKLYYWLKFEKDISNKRLQDICIQKKQTEMIQLSDSICAIVPWNYLDALRRRRGCGQAKINKPSNLWSRKPIRGQSKNSSLLLKWWFDIFQTMIFFW